MPDLLFLQTFRIGAVFHSTPTIYHVHNTIDEGVLRPGDIFTIEPIVNAGTARSILWPDGWTVATKDGQLSAQFENTLLVTENGIEEVTAKLSSSPKYQWM
jgi:methionyl aminopeptidase